MASVGDALTLISLLVEVRGLWQQDKANKGWFEDAAKELDMDAHFGGLRDELLREQPNRGQQLLKLASCAEKELPALPTIEYLWMDGASKQIITRLIECTERTRQFLQACLNENRVTKVVTADTVRNKLREHLNDVRHARLDVQLRILQPRQAAQQHRQIREMQQRQDRKSEDLQDILHAMRQQAELVNQLAEDANRRADIADLRLAVRHRATSTSTRPLLTSFAASEGSSTGGVDEEHPEPVRVGKGQLESTMQFRTIASRETSFQYDPSMMQRTPRLLQNRRQAEEAAGEADPRKSKTDESLTSAASCSYSSASCSTPLNSAETEMVSDNVLC